MKTFYIDIPDDRGKLYEVIHYPAGEIQVRLTAEGIFETVGKEKYTIEANPIPDLMELAQLKSALDDVQRWHYRTLELPYLPYARADRRTVPGEAFALEVFANFINNLNFNIVYTFDVHSPVADSLIKGLINLDPIHSYDQITPCVEAMGGSDGLCLIAPDAGASRRYDLAAYGWPVVVGGKRRDPKTGKLSGFEIEAGISKYRKGLIIDDICDGGGTFIGLAEQIHRLNPKMELSLYVSHGIFSKGLEPLLRVFKNIYTSDFSFKNPNIRWRQNLMTQTLHTLKDTLTYVKFPNFTYDVLQSSRGEYYLQGRYEEEDTVTGKMEMQYTRKWLLSPEMTRSEVVQTAFKCILTSMEHRAREWFTYRGRSIFGPHFDVDKLHGICESEENYDGRKRD
jgi:ribose-phosphate pyrophosphokinase